MKTTMTISVEESIKEDFKLFAKDLGTNPTNLLSMFMRDASRKRMVNFSSYKNLNLELDSFSNEELEDLENDKQIIKNTKIMEKLLAKV